jgi:hypothetical protein
VAVTLKGEMQGDQPDGRYVDASRVLDARTKLLAEPSIQQRFHELDARRQLIDSLNAELRAWWSSESADGKKVLLARLENNERLFNRQVDFLVRATEGMFDMDAIEAVLRAYKEGRLKSGKRVAFILPPSVPLPNTQGRAVRRLRGKSEAGVVAAVKAWAGRAAGDAPQLADEIAAGDSTRNSVAMARKRLRDRLHALER